MRLEERRLLTLAVELNYQYDSGGFFSSQAVRNLMQQAANSDVADLGDTLQAIAPSGTNTWTASFGDASAGINKSISNLSVPGNTLVIYVFGTALPGSGEAGDGMTGGFSASGDQAWLNTVSSRGKSPSQYSTWGGGIAFDTSHTNWYFGADPAQITANQTDFLTVAEHEIGHVLGLGTSTQWQNLVTNQHFTGAAAEAAYGGPVPLDPGLAHWAEGTMSDGHPATMDPVLVDGTRNVFTTLDYAGLQDVGWNFQAPVLQFAQANPNAAENAGSVTITVNRTGGTGPATIQYATSNGSAVAGVDYTAESGTLTFPIGSTSESFTVPLLNNPNASGPVTVNISLTKPTAGAKIGGTASAVLTINPVSSTPAPSAPVLLAQDDTGVSNSDRITAHNGSTAAHLDFTVSGVSPANGYVRLYANGNLVSGPIQATAGTASFTLAGSPLSDGVYQFTATSAPTTNGGVSAASAPTTVTIQTSLQVAGVSPAGNFATSLPNGQVVLTFTHKLAGLTPDVSNGSAFTSNPFAVMLVPSGPDGGALFAAHAASLWTAPSGVDSGDLPVPATLVYHENANGTSQITLTPALPLSTDIYLISANGLTDLAGNALTGGGGPGTTYYTSFDLHASPVNATPLAVTSVTANRGAVVINNNSIPQPDTIGITFSKALSTWTVNTSTIHLYAQTGPGTTAPVQAAVAYSPTTDTAYLTPEAILTPGTVYFVAVDPKVSDDQAFPNPGGTLAQEFTTSFTVSAPAVSGSSPLTVLRTAPTNGTQYFQPLGYGAVTFSEAVNLQSLSRFSAMLIPHTGGVTTGGSGYADVPMNAKVAFNPNTNQLIIVPTEPLANNIYLFSLSGIKATNGDSLVGTTAYSTFQLLMSGSASSALAAQSASAPLRAVTPLTTTSTPTGPSRAIRLNREVPVTLGPTRRVVPQSDPYAAAPRRLEIAAGD
ncbi:MAG: Calx-beta domain-containing protein [Isosphaeraceae bacterium]|nr:Calx-beta domain-containing protein [Isosphaeraceae bacterium]